ncbi:MAG: alpha/beta fold hydrolase [Desulfobulbaceae bacterium]|nr:alpha/beta fold hydrolase [Desulfobulbaceae bacterium]
MGKVTLRGVSINYRSLGQGEDVVLIHGLAANQGFWSPAVLMPLMRKYRVTLLDLRGHGHSSMPARGYSSRELAADLRALFEYLGIKNATLIGHSYGGVVALHSAVLYPEMVKRLVLADTRIRAFQPHLSSREVLENKKFAAKLAAIGLQLPKREQETGLWLLEQLAKPEWRDKVELFQRSKIFIPFGGWNRTKSHKSAERWLALMQNTTAKQDFQNITGLTCETIASISKPTLALCGGNSSALRTLEALQGVLPLCQTEIIPDVGHFFPLTHPHLFTQKVLHFLQFGSKKERRIHKRFTLNLPIHIHHENIQDSVARMKNASLEGMLIESDLQLNIGNEIRIIMQGLPNIPAIAFEGEIIRAISISSHGCSYGIRSARQTDRSREWEKLVEALNEHPEMIQFNVDMGSVG